MSNSLLVAVILGLIEGITEYLPVSSTGHLIIAGRWLGVEGAKANAFEIFIQLGAILAVVWECRRPILAHLSGLPRDPVSRRLVGCLLLAFVPAAVMGLLLHGAIERHLFSEVPVAGAMIVGGILILLVESRPLSGTTRSIETITWRQALAVGIAQIASLFPGFSRAAATILGGLLAGMSRPVATEFSFYLAIPTLGAASVYSLLEELPRLGASDIPFFGCGLVASFLSAAIVIRTFLSFVRTHTFRVFAWYRIGAGIVLAVLVLTRQMS